MYEVVLPVPTDPLFWRRGGHTDLLESRQGRLSKGGWYKGVHPRDSLIEWMQEFTPSWAYYHDVDPPYRVGYMGHQDPIGILFAFAEAKDAVLFKLTYS